MNHEFLDNGVYEIAPESPFLEKCPMSKIYPDGGNYVGNSVLGTSWWCSIKCEVHNIVESGVYEEGRAGGKSKGLVRFFFLK